MVGCRKTETKQKHYNVVNHQRPILGHIGGGVLLACRVNEDLVSHFTKIIPI
jgi:hypothetical protein